MSNLLIKAAALFDVPIGAILSDRRHAEVVAARSAIAYAATRQGHRQCTIARALGRDHSTIIAAVRQAARRAHADPWYAAALAELCGAEEPRR